MRQRRKALPALALLIVSVLLGGCGTSTAEEASNDPADYFADETITIHVGFPPGGGYDTFARMFQRHASEHFPGAPEIVVENIPGSAGLRAKQTTMQAEADGLSATLLHPTHVKRSLVGIDVETFDIDEILIVGAPGWTTDSAAAYVRRDIATTWEEVQQLDRDLSWGTTEPGAPVGLFPEFLDLLGVPGFNVVHGYGGTAEILAAFDRGELEATSAGGPELAGRLFPEWIENQFHVPIVWWNEPLPDDFLEDLGVEQPPYLFDVIDATEQQQEVFEVAIAINNITWAVALAPDTPDFLYQAWQEAFAAIVTDPDFIADMEGAGYEVGLGTPEEIQANFDVVRDLTPEGLDLFRQLSGVVE